MKDQTLGKHFTVEFLENVLICDVFEHDHDVIKRVFKLSFFRVLAAFLEQNITVFSQQFGRSTFVFAGLSNTVRIYELVASLVQGSYESAVVAECCHYETVELHVDLEDGLNIYFRVVCSGFAALVNSLLTLVVDVLLQSLFQIGESIRCPRHEHIHASQVFVFVRVQEILKLNAESVQVLMDQNGFALRGQWNLGRFVQVHLDTLLFLVQSLLNSSHILGNWIVRQEIVGLASVVLLRVLKELIFEAVLIHFQVLSLGLRVIFVQSKLNVAVDDLKMKILITLKPEERKQNKLTPDTKLELIVSPLRSLSISRNTAFVTLVMKRNLSVSQLT